jgi:hypothetical protein
MKERLTEIQKLKRIIRKIIKEETNTIPGDAPGPKQIHLFDFDDTLGVTSNANAVMLYKDGVPVHKSEDEVRSWLKSMGVQEKDLLDPGITPVKERGGAYAAYINSAALAKIQSKIPKSNQFFTGSDEPQGKSDQEEVLIDFTPSSYTDPETTKPIKSTIQKLKNANAKGAKTAVVTARTPRGKVKNIRGEELEATNSKDMEDWLASQGAKPTDGVYGVSGGDKGEKIKSLFISKENPPEEVHFYDDMARNTNDVAGALGEKVPSEVYIYGPGEFAKGEADPDEPKKKFPAKEDKSKNESIDLGRWSLLAGIKN